MSKNYKVYDLAYIRDGDRFYTREAVILATLMNTVGKGRNSKDMDDVREIMRDQNLEPNKKVS